jgi:competence protein ComEA
VYRLPASARISDLVAAAGGMMPDADIDRINLAQPLSDGVRVYVPRIGEQDPPAPAAVDSPGGVSAGPGGDTTGGDGASSSPAAAPIDLNSASLAELDELPGVGPATAQAIVSFRETNGPFSSVDALLEVRGIGPAKLEQIRPLVRT